MLSPRFPKTLKVAAACLLSAIFRLGGGMQCTGDLSSSPWNISAMLFSPNVMLHFECVMAKRLYVTHLSQFHLICSFLGWLENTFTLSLECAGIRFAPGD